MATDMYGFMEEGYQLRYIAVFDTKHDQGMVKNDFPYLVIDTEDCVVMDWHADLASARGQATILNAQL